ncbi:MAG: hypothetical protein ACREKE_08145, partial [bacterium]
MVTGAARFIDHGAYPFLYQARNGFDALPLPALLMAPVVALGDHLHLVEGYPEPVLHPTMWLIVGPI